MNLIQLLSYALAHNASDLHLSANSKPWLRINGILAPMKDAPVYQTDELEKMLFACMDENSIQVFKKRSEVDFAYGIENGDRFRVNVYRQADGIAGAFRTIPSKIANLTELGMPDIIKEVALLPRGLVLVTGPTGCGKSTTLASMIDYINANRNAHIITVEDPIECLHANKQCLVHQREVFRDTTSFSLALKASLREDPDIILIGEMRDLETIRLSLTAAETGHLVFGTLHTVSAVKSIARIIDVFPREEKALVRTMLSEALKAVLSQLLVQDTSNGRVAVTELMICNAAIRNLIREDKLPQAYSVLQTGAQFGMYTLDQNLAALVEKGVITRETAFSVAHDRRQFMG